MSDERTLEEKIIDKKALLKISIAFWKEAANRAKSYRKLIKEYKKELAALQKKRKANERAKGKV